MQTWNESIRLAKEKLLSNHYQNVVSLPLSDETEMGSGGDQPNRDSLTEWNEKGGQNISQSYSSIPIENASQKRFAS